jgi:hypothetical protein
MTISNTIPEYDFAEKAVLYYKELDFSGIAGKFDRLYFGTEFCERLLPTPKLLEQVFNKSRDAALCFTLLTPFVTDAGMKNLVPLLEWLDVNSEATEVVVNDFGVLHLLRNEYPSLIPVLGRLLTKQKRGPRLIRILDIVPDKMKQHFMGTPTDIDDYRSLIEKYGIKRLEFDNPLQGVARLPWIPASIYYPYAYISTTRICLAADCENRKKVLRRIIPCAFECSRYMFTLTHDAMPVPLLLKGNTYFLKNETLPPDLNAQGIDRLVLQMEPPVAPLA